MNVLSCQAKYPSSSQMLQMSEIWTCCSGVQKDTKVCGEEHSYDECKNGKDTCCNCGGQHMVTYGGCEVWKKAVEIEQIKVINNISYTKATIRVKKPKDVSGKVQIRPIPEQTDRN